MASSSAQSSVATLCTSPRGKAWMREYKVVGVRALIRSDSLYAPSVTFSTMHTSTLIAAFCGLTSVVALDNPHRRAAKLPRNSALIHDGTKHANKKRQSDYSNPKTSKFAVNGTGIPEVDFDIGESYAGTLPINSNSTENALWFWYFPSENSAADDEIVLWLNGGPGCSSLDGLLQENGPFLWQSGTYSPIENPWSWTNLTNMVWVDQPIGTGFSPAAEGAPAALVNEQQV